MHKSPQPLHRFNIDGFMFFPDWSIIFNPLICLCFHD